MSKTITFPNCRSHFFIYVNGKLHTYEAGSTVEVDDSIAGIIQNHLDLQPKEDPNAGKGSGGGEGDRLPQFLRGELTEITAEDLNGVSFCGGLFASEDGGEAYRGMSLKKITIPATVRSLSGIGLGYCFGLESIELLSKNPPDVDYSSLPYGVTLVIPNGSMSAYRNDGNWQELISSLGITLVERD